MAKKSVLILGTRGIPANHGGFETFAEALAPHLAAQGWDVTVYCQRDVPPGSPEDGAIETDTWNGVRRVIISVSREGPRGTMLFDWRCVRHARHEPGVALVLGYNTALFSMLLRFGRAALVTNMDGIEWRRSKWPWPAKLWFFVNELVACASSTALIADHPGIARHLRWRLRGPVHVIPYGSDEITEQDAGPLQPLGLERDGYVMTVCRIEPENSILEIVKAYGSKPRPYKLLVLGRLLDGNPYHAAVRAAATQGVVFPGPIFDRRTIRALRAGALAYVHGHTVGGTNPSLVEALGAGNAVIAHDNQFNTWTAGPQQFYFRTGGDLEQIFDALGARPERLEAARSAARARHQAAFRWETVLGSYGDLLGSFLKNPTSRETPASGDAGSPKPTSLSPV